MTLTLRTKQGCITIESFDLDMPKIAKLCCICAKFADSPEALATEGLKYLKEVHREASTSNFNNPL